MLTWSPKFLTDWVSFALTKPSAVYTSKSEQACYVLNQSAVKPKPIETCLTLVFPHLAPVACFSRFFDFWLVACFCLWFGFGSTIIRNNSVTFIFYLLQTSVYIIIDVPRTSKYQLIFHYLLARYAPVTAFVKFIPTLDSGKFWLHLPSRYSTGLLNSPFIH